MFIWLILTLWVNINALAFIIFLAFRISQFLSIAGLALSFHLIFSETFSQNRIILAITQIYIRYLTKKWTHTSLFHTKTFDMLCTVYILFLRSLHLHCIRLVKDFYGKAFQHKIYYYVVLTHMFIMFMFIMLYIFSVFNHYYDTI